MTEAIYTDLSRLLSLEEYEKAIKTTNKILSVAPGEEKAFCCKVICFVKLGKFDDALSAIHKNTGLAGNLQFEKAYCEYRLNRTAEAMKTITAAPEMDSRMKELYAQVLYRTEDFSSCLSVYKDLVKNTQDDFEDEREANLASVFAALETWGGGAEETLGLREHTYELVYNAACSLIGRKQFKKALEKLKKAEALCRASLEEDPDNTEDDVHAELGVIRVQMGYVLQQLGQQDEALKLYNVVIKQKPSDIGLAAVASNNIVTINKDQNVFDSKKKIKVATADGLQQKLVSEQRKTIAMNQCLLYMYTNQGDQCKKTARRLREQYPGTDTPTLIEASQCLKDKQISAAVDLLQSEISKATDVSVNLKLTLAQLHLTQGSVFQACDVLRSLGDLAYSPGIVSALVTLYGSQEDHSAAGDFLMEAIEWQQKNNAGSEQLAVLMRSCARYHLKYGEAKTAAKLLEQLRKKNPRDHKVLAQLIAAYSKFDAQKAQLVSKELPSVEQMAADLDVEALEQAACTFGPKYIKKTATKTDGSPPQPLSPKSGDGETADLAKKKKKKNKKGKLPKNYEVNGYVDPERWLPRRERSYYKGKRRDKRKEIGKGPQGAVSANADLYDASKTAAVAAGGTSSPGNTTPGGSEPTSPKPGAASPAASAAVPNQPGPRQQKPASAASKAKKKKKGGKW